ncbi:MAG: hypothetical protein M3198_19960 [Actinomycetota bacterium]|nr:hypothetical protein [Actinomycetota bacterium]
MISLIMLVVVLSATPSLATHPVIHQPPNVHWRNSHTQWHWGANLDNNYPQFKTPTNKARTDTWTSACCPDSQWHAHYDTAFDNHVNVKDCSNPSAPGCAVTSYNGNSSLHMTLGTTWFDVDYVSQFYTGTGHPADNNTPNEIDAWSVAAEEYGHVQNMHHFGSGCDTMSGFTEREKTCKRFLNSAEKSAAQEPYDSAHPGTFSNAINEIWFE